MKKPKGRKVNILYCSMALTFGGEQKQLGKILSGINQARYESVVCCIRNYSYVEERIKKFAGKFICLQMQNRYNILGEIWQLYKIIKKVRIDLIHTGVFGSDFSPLLAAMITRTPAVVFLTTTYDLEPRLVTAKCSREFLLWKMRVFYMIHGILARLIKVRYIAYSETIKESAVKNLHLPVKHVTILPLGQELDEFSVMKQKPTILVNDEFSLNGSYPILLNVARLSPVKGQTDLVKTMPLVLKHFPDAKLLIAGDGDMPIMQELLELRDSLGLKKHVHLLGRRDDIMALLNASDFFVFGSYYEGLPGAVIEAMAAGKPVVAFDIPSLKEVVQDQYNGFLVNERNVEKFAEAVIQLAKHPEIAREIGSRGREIVSERFDIRKNINSLESIYEKMLGYQ